jgi:urease gamma subunit
MMNISKSKYCSICQCPKIAWLKLNKPEEYKVLDSQVEERMRIGQAIGKLAQTLFPDPVDVTVYKSEEDLDISAMIRKTEAEIAKGTETICEAAFSYHNLYCAVDILHKEADGYSLYEVKSSTSVKDVYLADIAFQKYVLKKCGIDLKHVNIVYINNEYVFDGKFDINQFFSIVNLDEEVLEQESIIEDVIRRALEVVDMVDEPDIDLSANCHAPYHCGFFEYCTRNLPHPNCFDMYRMRFDKKLKLYHDGNICYEDIEPVIAGKASSYARINQMQVETLLYDKKVIMNKEGIRGFLDSLTYPLYFLDFETIQPVIPEYIGTRPYMQITTQYSLHYIEYPGGPLLHKEYLASGLEDPRRGLAEKLCEDIPMGVCTIAYNKQFECTRIKELADEYPDLADHLNDIKDHIVDLMDPFTKGFYYDKNFGKSLSIKVVLPTFFPDDPELDYHALEDVHNGGEAMEIFPKLKDMDPATRERVRNNLLKYCCLDTLAMVRIWEKLGELVKD